MTNYDILNETDTLFNMCSQRKKQQHNEEQKMMHSSGNAGQQPLGDLPVHQCILN